MGRDPDKAEKGTAGAGHLGTQFSRGHCPNHPALLFPRPQLAMNIGNARFNEVMEAQLPSHGGPKPSAESDM